MKFPNKKYSIIYADPPWSYRQHGTGPKSRGNAAQHYRTMTVEDICALPVQDITANGALLFLWATFPTIPDALEVMHSWGFEYKTAAFVWVKKHKSGALFWGMGAYTRANAEVCLLGVTPEFKAKEQILQHNVHQIVEAPFAGHSVKPDEVRKRIVKLVGDAPPALSFLPGSARPAGTYGAMRSKKWRKSFETTQMPEMRA